MQYGHKQGQTDCLVEEQCLLKDLSHLHASCEKEEWRGIYGNVYTIEVIP